MIAETKNFSGLHLIASSVVSGGEKKTFKKSKMYLSPQSSVTPAATVIGKQWLCVQEHHVCLSVCHQCFDMEPAR